MAFQGDSIYWVEVEKVVPNPFQPRREFDDNKLQELSESIRMYGVLQPLTVTRREVQNPENGTFYTEYELIAGERRLRASRLAGIAQVPVIIRDGEQSEQEKLELAIIENLQREDLNAVDRALAFQQLAEQFKLNHAEVGRKVGRSREYVANSIRLLQLPEHMRSALQRGELGEGHARTLLMLNDRPEEQETVFREVLLKKMSVRELERIARKIATDKVRKPNKNDIDQHLIDIEKEFTETLGTRVQIQKTDFGGKLTIDYFSEDDLSALLERVRAEQAAKGSGVPDTASATLQAATPMTVTPAAPVVSPAAPVVAHPTAPTTSVQQVSAPATVDQTLVMPSQPPAPAPQPTGHATPAADPGLLERLASFTQSHAAPAASPVPQESATPNPVAAPVSSAQPQPTQSAATTPQENVTSPSDESDDDLYSMRNFTV